MARLGFAPQLRWSWKAQMLKLKWGSGWSVPWLSLGQIAIRDSPSVAISIFAPGSKPDEGTLLNGWLEKVSITHSRIGAASRHDLWVREDVVGEISYR